MAQNAAIVVPDGKATPVNHTFSPMKNEAGTASYANLAGAFQAGRETYALNLKESAKLRTVKSTMIVPRIVTETVNGVTSSRVADFVTVVTTYLVPLTWADADIKDVRTMSKNAASDAIVVAAVDRGESVW